MKKFLLILLVIFTLAMTFTACEDDSNTGSTSQTSTPQTSTSQPSTSKTVEERVAYISNRTIYYREEDSQFELHFQLLDADESPLAAACTVKVKIVNDQEETVYSATKEISGRDYSTWTYNSGEKRFQATIYIKDSEITPGKSSNGKVYFKVYNTGNFDFDELTLSINNNLPMKETNIELPSLPQTISEYSSGGKKLSSCNVTGIRYKVTNDDLYIYFTLEKTYDSEGASYSRSGKIGWKLYDSEGYVLASDTYYSDSIKVGDKIKDGQDTAYNCIEPGGSYRLEIMSIG